MTDIERQTNRHITAAVGLGTLVFFIIGWAIRPGRFESLDGTNGDVWVMAVMTALIAGVAMLIVIYPILTRPRELMHYECRGYDVDWSFSPRKWFGQHTYTIIRTDAGIGEGVHVGSPKSFEEYYQYRDRVKRQRDTPCEVCGESQSTLHNSRKRYEYAETWRAFYLFGVPTQRQLVDEQAFCSEHTDDVRT